MTRIPLVAFGGAAALALAMGVARFAYTPILPAMHHEAGLATAQAGVLATLNFAGYMAGTLLPLFARRLGLAPGPKSMLRAGLATCLVTTLAMAFTDTYAVWGLLRFLSGVASALTMIYASALVLDALARRGTRGGAGIHYGGVGVGITVSGLMVMALEAAGVGWRVLWLGATALIALLVPEVLLTVARRSAPAPAGARPSVAIADAPPVRNHWWLVAAYACSGTGFIVSGTFLPLIAKQQPETAPYAAFCWVLVGIAAIPSNVFWDLVARRAGATASLMVQYVLQVIGVLLPVFSRAPWAILASGVILGGTFMGIVTVANGEARNIAPHRTAEMVALMTAAYSIGQIVGPPVAGYLAAAGGSFDGGLGIAAATLLLGIALLVVDARVRRR